MMTPHRHQIKCRSLFIRMLKVRAIQGDILITAAGVAARPHLIKASKIPP